MTKIRFPALDLKLSDFINISKLLSDNKKTCTSILKKLVKK
jgi:hypothetical protein